MNAHTPFDANQDWSNPYCRNSSNDPLVDALLGNAYHVVRTVYCNLGYIKHLYDFLSQYGVVICVQSEAELKTLTTEAKYARIYDKSPAGDRRVTDYLYVDDDRTGILPDDTTATGSWINVATSNSGDGSKDGGYIPWVYNSGSANGGETSIRIPDETAGAPFMIVNGDWQTEGYDFEYDPSTFEIKFTTPLEQGDFVVVMRTGIPATPDNPNVSDWVTINWLYNHGAAVGGEQVIDIPYTFQSVPAVYKNGLRFSKGLANNSYTIDPDNNRIILTEPLATNDRLVIQLGGEAKVLETVDHTIQEVARAANVKDSEVILSTDNTQVLNGKRVIYDVVTQRIYGLPTLPTNVYINTVSNGQLIYSPGNVTVTLLDSYQQQNTRELWRRSLAEAGLTLVDGSFEEGATANSKTDAVWYIAGGQCYTWDSTFPRDVPAKSAPATTGGVGVGAWLSVGDAALRQELLLGPVSLRDNGLALRNVVTVSDFKGRSGFDNNSSSALIAFINHINSGASDDAVYLIDGLYKTTVPLPKITRPVRLVGNSTAHSAILFSNVTNGLSLDLSAMTSGTVHSELARFSILTDKTLAGVGFEFLPNSGNSQSVKLELNSMRVDSLDRFNGGTSNCEWLTSVKLGDDSLNSKPSEVRIDNLIAYGSDLNANYSTLTGSGSSGIVASKATNCIVTRSKIFLMDGWGIKLNGQTEGNHVHFSQVVATRHGIGIAGTVNPSNNHYISNTHVSPYETGIKIDLSASPNVSTPIETYLNDIFILERNEATNKPGGFVGVDLAARYSKLTNVTVWANAKSPGIHTKIGFRIGCAGNVLTNCHSHRMSYALDTFEVINGFAYDVALDEFFEEDSILGFITPTAFKQPAGNARAMSLPGRTWKRPVTFTNQFSLIHESGVTFFDVNSGSVSLRSPTNDTTQIQHYPSTQTVPGAGLIALGGTGTAYKGNWYMKSALTLFSGSIRPEDANAGTCGTSGAPWAGGFTQTAFTVTSDEKFKTAPLEITDAILDAAEEVQLVQYKYLDRIEEKGEDGARWHFGAIAQQYVEAFAKHGIDAHRFGFICYDEWDDTPAVVNDETGEVVAPAIKAGSRYGIRYEEMLVLEAAVQRRKVARLESRIESLEALLTEFMGK